MVFDIVIVYITAVWLLPDTPFLLGDALQAVVLVYIPAQVGCPRGLALRGCFYGTFFQLIAQRIIDVSISLIHK
jgi:hypothetical protein